MMSSSKNDRPFLDIGNHVQPIGSLVERLALDGDRVAERDRRIDICAGTPHLPIRHQAIPDLSAVYERTVILDRDICDADRLRYLCGLALQRQVKYRRLRSTNHRNGGHRQAKQKYSHSHLHREQKTRKYAIRVCHGFSRVSVATKFGSPVLPPSSEKASSR